MKEDQGEFDSLFVAQRTESEKALVSAVIQHPDYIPRVQHVVGWHEIIDQFLAQTYRLAIDLFDAGKLSYPRLRSALRDGGYLRDVSEVQEFADLCREFSPPALAEWHASELARISAARKVYRELSAGILRIDATVKPDELVQHIVGRLEAIKTNQDDLWEPVSQVAERVIETHRTNSSGNTQAISTGFTQFDTVTGGFFPGQLWQIAARSGVGKTAMALSLANKVAKTGHGVYFASYEMPHDELMERILASKFGVSLDAFTHGLVKKEMMDRIQNSKGKITDLRWLLDQDPPSSVNGLKARVRLAQNTGPIHLVVVDHLALFPHTDRRVQRHQQLLEVTRDLKLLAKSLGVTVLLLNQLNTDADGAEPSDKHYAESKGVIQHMDVSLLLHRKTKVTEELECIFTKVRKGKAARCKLLFDTKIQRISELPPVATQPELPQF